MPDHRRVEPRGVVATGMNADIDRVRDVEAEYERGVRRWQAPEKGFGAVLGEAPAKGELADDDAGDDPRKRKRRQQEQEQEQQAEAPAPSGAVMTSAAMTRPPPKQASASAPAPISLEGMAPVVEQPAPAAAPTKAELAQAAARKAAADAKAEARKALPKVAPDPRERLLREKLAANMARPRAQPNVDTPPTGSHKKRTP